MTQIQAVQIWLNGAEEALETANLLFSSKKYDHALFFGQLYLEKLLKAIHYHLKNDHPIYTHKLVLLANKCGIKLNTKQMDQLEEVTAFNVSARYPENKQDLYKKATAQYSEHWLSLIKDLGNYFKEYLN